MPQLHRSRSCGLVMERVDEVEMGVEVELGEDVDRER